MRVPVRDVLVADASRRTTRVNAYVSGLGRTRQVVVYDTLLAAAGSGPPDGAGDPPPSGTDEVVLVVAHELAHVRHRDVLWGRWARPPWRRCRCWPSPCSTSVRSSGPSG